MGSQSGYAVVETLYEDEGEGLYRAVREADGTRVLLKILRGRREYEAKRLEHEHELCQQLDTPVIVHALALGVYEGRPMLVFEDRGEPLLRAARPGTSLTLARFLRLSIRLTRALEELHARGLTHRNLKPQHVLVDPRTDEVTITGLGLASFLPREQKTWSSPWVIEGSLPYMSPEQTGRSGLAVDYRTDLYSLGITLFELRSGKRPFEADDPLGFIHAHLARPPPSLCQAAPETPLALGQVIDKLLSKAPEDRYQSAVGLRHDLERCFEQLTSSGQIEPFPLAQRDVFERFQIPQRLYGREADLALLSGAFNRVVATGRPELVLIRGYSGIGKSALVHQLQKRLVQERGLFHSGKCDQLRRGIPYFPLSQALRSLMLDLLAEPEASVAEWRARIREALGTNAQLIVDIVPELERLIDRQSPVQPLPFNEDQRRFYETFRRFLALFAQRAHPLMLFLDDLQWADSASLAVLEHVLENAGTQYLLVVAAYRDNEVDAAHPLQASVRAIREAGTAVHELTMGPLTQEDVFELVSDTVHRPREEVMPLARLIHGRTAGNPFFVVQFLNSLYEDGLLRLDHQTSGFCWEMAAIRARGFTDNVVELMVERLRKLSDGTLRALELAACVGSSFEANLLSAIRGQSEGELLRDLWEGLRAGVILHTNGDYRFVHDRVHQAAYSLIAQGQPDEVHLQIGRHLLAHIPEGQLGERALDIVGQLNRGARLLVDPREKEQVAALNLVACRKAKAAAAYAAAVEYARIGMLMLGETAWEETYHLALDLHIERAHSAYLSGDFDSAETLLSLAVAHAHDRLDRAAAYDILVQLYTTKSDTIGASRLGLEYLSQFGVELPAQPTTEDVSRACQRVFDELGAPIEALLELPRMREPEFEALMQVLTSASSAALLSNTKLWALFSCERVLLSIKHGNTDASAHAFSAFGLVLVALFGDLERAHRFGKVAVSMVDELGFVAFRAQVYLNACVFVDSWVEPLEKIWAAVQRAYRAGAESGLVTYACYAASAMPMVRLTRGDPLREVKKEAEAQYEFLKRNRFGMIQFPIQVILLLVQRLIGRGDLNAVDETEAYATTQRLPALTFWFLAREVEACVILGEYDKAREAGDKAHSLIQTVPAFFPVSDYVYYYALALAQCGRVEQLAEQERRLRAWAESCPTTYLDRAQLVQAEMARLEERAGDAALLYERAIETARRCGFVHHEGLGAELAAKFYEAQGLHGAALNHLQSARAAYLRWGATIKVEQLDRGDRRLAVEPQTPIATFTAGASELDLLSIMKASQTISSELGQDELTRALIRVVVEQAGAQRGVLILERDGKLRIAAVAESEVHGVRVDWLHEVLPELSDYLPETIRQYVVRASEPVILGDALVDGGRFTQDSYIQKHRSRSVLCLPIVRGDEALGYFYLENPMVKGAFTQDRLQIVQALAAQAAISLENARLYDALRASEAKLVNLFEALPVGVLVVDSQGNPVISNRKGAEIMGWRHDHALTMEDVTKQYQLYRAGTNQLYPPQDTPLGKALRGEPSMVDDAEVRRNDNIISLASWGTPIFAANGSVVYAVVAFQDISSQRSAEAARAQLEEQLQQTERLDSVGRLAGGVAHDLNNLLLPILAYSELILESRDVSEPAKAQIRQIRTAAQRAAELIGQLLAFGRRQVLEAQELELGHEIRELEPMLRRMLREDIAPEFRIASEPSLVRADRSQIQRVLMNLAINAVDAMPAGGHLTIATENVMLSEDFARSHQGLDQGPYVVLRISDTGHGMDDKTLARIFEPFFTTKPFGKGTGLGLPTVYGLVKQHGGHIEVQSRPGHGTTFELFFPRIESEAAAPLVARAETEVTPAAQSPTILVVDDDPVVLAVLRRVLALEHYHVVASCSPSEALTLAQKLERRLDLLITDVTMPDMNGRELFERVARENPNVRALFISGYSDDVLSVSGAGFELLRKPFSLDALKTKVREVLARSAAGP